MAEEETPGAPPVVAVIGGSGIYDIEGLEGAEWRTVKSSFGEPSSFVTVRR